MIISSTDNNLVKKIASLKNAKNRKEQGLFFAEGERIVFDALKSGRYKPQYIILREDKAAHFNIKDAIIVDSKVFDKLSDTLTPQGVLAVFEYPKAPDTAPKGDFLVLDRISDPGNLGTIIRSAAAAGVERIYTINSTDAHSPKAIRASMGGFMYCDIIQTDLNYIKQLKKQNILVAADMGGQNIFCCNKIEKTKNYGLIIGSEACGISAELFDLADLTLSIPTVNVESLNAAVAASIILFWLKQKKGE